MIEEPDPREPRRSARWALSIVAALLTAGAMAAGAWALTGSSGTPAAPVAKPAVHRLHTNDASWRAVGEHPCGRMHHRATDAAKASVRY